MEWLICYDIRKPQRLQRIYRYLCQVAMPIEYSVFLFYGTKKQLDNTLDILQKLFKASYDDIRAYPLPKRGRRWRIGRPVLPQGISLSQLPVAWYDFSHPD